MVGGAVGLGAPTVSTVTVSPGQASACATSAARSAGSTVSAQRTFTAVQAVTYAQTPVGGSHCSGPRSDFDWLSALPMATSELAEPRSL